MTTNWIASTRPCDFTGFKDAFGTGVGSMLTVHELGLVARVCTFFRDQVTRRTLDVVALEIQQTSSSLVEKVKTDYDALFKGDKRHPSSIFDTYRRECYALMGKVRLVVVEGTLCDDLQSCWKQYESFSREIEREWWKGRSGLGLSPRNKVTEERHAIFLHNLSRQLSVCMISKENEWALKPDWEAARRAELHEGGFPAVTIDEKIESQRSELNTIAAVQNENLGRALRALQEFFMRERLTHSFNRVFTDAAIPQNERWGRWAGDLLATARETGVGRVQLRALIQNSRPLRETMLGVHRIVDETEPVIAKSLSSLGSALSREGLGIDFDPDNPRSLLESERARERLERIASLMLFECSDIPRAIGRFQGLTSIRVDGRIAYLPDELASLPNLQSVVLWGSNFSSLPPLLERMPALTQLRIFNMLPIREFPDGLARKLHTSRLDMMWTSAWQGFTAEFSAPDWDEKYERQKYFGLSRVQFTNIPFYFWFEESFSIPYIPGGLFAWPFITLFESLVPEGRVRHLLSGPFMIFLAAITLPTLPLLFILNLPIFAYNLLLNLAIEPVVTYFRDQLGYSRMVAV
ncbi:MAG: hypothetical protein HYX48_04210 [Chlamydiales bacterium]|nr:hypothetical protein [Chlamydiales bacterium]